MSQSFFVYMPPVTPFTRFTNVTLLQIFMCDLTKILNIEFFIALGKLYLNVCLVHFYVNIISFCYNIFFNSSLFKIIVVIIEQQKAENSTVLYMVKLVKGVFHVGYYRGVDKSLVRPGRKEATVAEDFCFIDPMYNYNWRNISTIYIYNKASIKRNIPAIKQNT
jgi:hypothetical protein